MPIYTKNNPIAPPNRQRIIASIKNSKRILLFLAPTAFFKPIIAVRSLTVTNIILAMPNKPTIRLMPPIIPPTIFNTLKKPVMALLNPLGNCGLSPYVLGGGGRQFDPTELWFAQFGAGLEYRFCRNVGAWFSR